MDMNLSTLKWYPKQIQKEFFVNLHENMMLFLGHHSVTWTRWLLQQARTNQTPFSCMEPVIKSLMGSWTIITAGCTKHVI